MQTLQQRGRKNLLFRARRRHPHDKLSNFRSKFRSAGSPQHVANRAPSSFDLRASLQ